MGKIMKKRGFKRCVSLMLALALILSSAVSDGSMFSGILNLDFSKSAKAAAIPDTAPLDSSIIPDINLLTYLKTTTSATTVKELRQYIGALSIPAAVTNITGLGLAVNATSFNLSQCTGLTSVPANCFEDCANATNITLSTTITEVGNNAFKNCVKLSTINIGQLDKIGSEAFAGCKALSDSSISNLKTSLTSLGTGAFQGCTTITTAKIPTIAGSAAHTVPTSLFSGCTNLVKITFCDTAVTTINDGAFSNTGNVTFSTGGSYGNSLPSSVASLGENAFNNSKIQKLDLSATKITEIKNSTFYQADLSDEITLPNNLTKIGKESFRYAGLKKIDMPNTVTFMDEGAFRYTPKLQEVALSVNLTAIPVYAFQGAGNGAIEESEFSEGSTALVVKFHGNASPSQSNLMRIGECSFNASNLADDTFLKGLTKLTTIERKAFSYVDWTTLTIPACVTTLGEAAFDGCYWLKTVTFAAGSQVTVLPDSLFGSNKSPGGNLGYADIQLESVCLPENLVAIGNYCFGHCYSLKTVGYNGKMTANEVNFPSTLTTLGEFSFYSCAAFDISGTSSYFNGVMQLNNGGIKKVTIPDSVTEIGKGAFKECTMLTDLTIGAKVKEIPEEMCMGCGAYPDNKKESDYLNGGKYTPISFVGLTNLVLPNGITKIGNKAFESCYALKGFATQAGSAQLSYLPDSLTEIGDNAFYQCKSLQKVVFPTALVKIGSSAFAEASQYINEKPDGNHAVDRAYYGLESLDFIHATNLESIGGNAFAKTNLTGITLPASLTSIPANFCNSCYNLEFVTLPADSKVEDVGVNAFKDCYNLSNVTLPFTAVWAKNIFAGYTGNAKKSLNVMPTKESDDMTIIWTRNTPLSFACFSGFDETTLSVTDANVDENNPNSILLDNPADPNPYIRVSSGSAKNGIILYGKQEGKAKIKVSGNVDLNKQGENYAFLTVNVSHIYNISVEQNPITTITVTSDKVAGEEEAQVIYLAKGDTKEFEVKAAFEPIDATEDIQWSIADSSIASITDATVNNGVSTIKIKAGDVGDTVLTLKSSKLTKTIPVKVRIPAKSVKLSEGNFTMATGKTKNLIATIEYDSKDENLAANWPETCEFTSDAPDIVSVQAQPGASAGTATAIITAHAEGTANITVKCLHSGKSVTSRVTVKTGYVPPVANVELNQKEAKMNVGATLELAATILPAEADQTVKWESSDETLATVQNGVVTALKPGKVTIKAVADKKDASCQITIYAPAKGLKIRATSGNTKKVFVKKGDSINLDPYYTNLNCTDTFKFKSKKSKAGSVSESGTVTTKKPGKIVVTVTAYNPDDKKTGSAKITVQVVKKAKKAKKVTIKGAKKVGVDKRICLLAKTKPAKSTASFTWSSSNDSVAKVNSYGVVTGVKKGKVKITAKPSRGKKKTITITVK